MSSRGSLLGVLLVVAASEAVAARPPATPELDAEREALIEKLIRGEDVQQSIAAFKDLVARRDPVIPTSDAAQKAARAKVQARREWQEEWRATGDAEVAWRCRLSADPKNPQPSDGWQGDWGKVTKKEELRLAPKNELDEGELWTVYEVVGQRRTYRFRADNFGIFRDRKFEANKGDLVLVCDGGTTVDRRLPPPWGEDFQRSGFAVRLKDVPRIAQKKKWNPIHITDNKLFWAIKDVKWRFPPEAFVLSAVEVDEDLGDGRYRIHALQDKRAVIEVPAGLANRDLLVPGQTVWAIMGNARFDRKWKTLVLTVEDLEPRYIEEPAEP